MEVFDPRTARPSAGGSQGARRTSWDAGRIGHRQRSEGERGHGRRTLLLVLVAAALVPGGSVAALALLAARPVAGADASMLAGVALLLWGLAVAGAVLLARRISMALEALRAAADHLARGEPVDLQPLGIAEADQAAAAMRRAHRLMQSRTQERDAALLRGRELARAAQRDPMTQLLNRAALESLLDRRLTANRGQSRPLTLFFIDIDDFKPVNDSHGHRVGDEMLRAFAARLRSGVRDGDCAARVGGDEFVVLFDGIASADAVPIAQELVERLSRPYSVQQLALRVGACIGVAGYPQDGNTAQALLEAADAAMYRAKAAGKNDFRVSRSSSL